MRASDAGGVGNIWLYRMLSMVRATAKCSMLHHLYTTEIHRHGTIFLSQMLQVYFRSLLNSKLWKQLYRVRGCVTVVKFIQDHRN